MQKLVWKNSLGDEIDLTSGHYGITEWEGFSGTELNIQSQQVPFQDGSVFLDALLSERELSVTLAMEDENNLETRYQLRRELIHILNPKLGEGYLIYTNDFISKRIKCVPHIPLFPTKNSNDPGTPKASLAWTACEPYFEDLEDTFVNIKLGQLPVIKNEGDIPAQVEIDFFTGNAVNPYILNKTTTKKIGYNGTLNKSLHINTNIGKKEVVTQDLYLNIAQSSIRFNDICFSAPLSMFVAVGDGVCFYSGDGLSWERISLNVNGDTYRCIWVDEKQIFVVVGENGNLLTSKDGVKWEKKTINTSNSLNAIIYLNSTHKFYIASGSNVIVSSDLETFTTYSTGISGAFDIAYSESLSLFVITTLTTSYATSTDGINWTARTIGVSIGPARLNYIEELGKFYLGGTQTDKYATSTDGINWTLITPNIGKPVYYLSYALGKIYACCTNGIIATSTDESSWEIVTTEQSGSNLRGFVYSAEFDLFVSVGNLATILNSEDGSDWETIKKGSSTIFNSICFSAELDLYVLVSNSGHIYTSSELENWTLAIKYTYALNKIIWIKEKHLFVAVGEYNITVISSDGINWEQVGGISSGLILYSVTYAKELGLIISCGSAGYIRTSEDGRTWTKRTTGTLTTFHDVLYSKKLGAVYSITDAVYKSTNGIDYSNIKNLNPAPKSFAYSENLGLFVLVGDNGKIWTSKDCITLAEQTSGTEQNLRNVYFSEESNLFIVVGNLGITLISPDGENWEKLLGGVTVQENGVSYNSKSQSFIVVGWNETVTYTKFSEAENQIQNLTSDSDIGFNLNVGDNQLQLLRESGDITCGIKFRQKYIGV